jgi:hypothetical protein
MKIQQIQQIQQIRDQIAALQAEKTSITEQPICRAAVEQAVRDGVKDCESASEAQTLQTLQRLAAGQPAPLLSVRAGSSIDLLTVFVRMLGTAAVTKALLRGLGEIPVGLAPEARSSRLAAITAERAALELQEEQLIRDGGDITPRRVDADPAAVLAL